MEKMKNTQGSNGDPSQNVFSEYMPNSTADDLNLPSLVSDKISGTPLPRKVTVKSISSGNIWRMEMTTNSEKTVFLRDGWKKIINDENVTGPVFLAFEFDGFGEFHFRICEQSSMCKMMISPLGKEVIQLDSKEETEDDDDNDDEDDDEYMAVVEYEEEITQELPPKTKQRGRPSRRRRGLKRDNFKFDDYLDNKQNPAFPVDISQTKTRIPSVLIKDYNLTFPNQIMVCDKIGKLKKKISFWENGSVYINGMGSFIRRNHVKSGDKMVCELKTVHGSGLVGEIKVHIIKA